MKPFIFIVCLGLLALVIVPRGSFAEDISPIQVTPEITAAAAAQAQQSPIPDKFHLELNQADLNALSIAINELPKRVADPLILKLNEQIKAQVKK